MRVSDFYITPEEYKQAAKNGVCSKTLEARIRNFAWSKERAINTPLQQRTPRYSREDWAVAKQNGIPHSTFRNRIIKLGWDVERAASEPLNDPKVFTADPRPHRRKYSDETLQQIKTNGIPYATFIVRIGRGWSIEDAATKSVMTQAKRKQHRL